MPPCLHTAAKHNTKFEEGWAASCCGVFSSPILDLTEDSCLSLVFLMPSCDSHSASRPPSVLKKPISLLINVLSASPDLVKTVARTQTEGEIDLVFFLHNRLGPCSALRLAERGSFTGGSTARTNVQELVRRRFFTADMFPSYCSLWSEAVVSIVLSLMKS